MAMMETKKSGAEAPDDILTAIADSDMWVVFTAKIKAEGAMLSLRQSSKEATINMIAMLLEQEDIYEAVTLKMSQLKEEDKKSGKKTTNTNIN